MSQMSYKKKRLLSYIAITSLVIVAYICRQISFKGLFLTQFAGQCRSSIYIGLYCAWVIYLEKHVVDAKMRQCLTWIACLMVFWFLVRTIKFLIFMLSLIHIFGILKERGIDTKVIICSSLNIKIREAYGCIWYSRISAWEMELLELMNQLKK